MRETKEHYVLKITSTTEQELGFNGFYFTVNEEGKQRTICRFNFTTPFELNAKCEVYGAAISLNQDEKNIPLKLEIIKKSDNSVLVADTGFFLLAHIDGKQNHIYSQ